MRTVFLLTVMLLTSLFTEGQELHKYGIDTTQFVPEGLPVNSYAPLFSASDVDGNQIDLRSTLLQSPVVLVFVRGAWSRHCRKFLSNLQDSLEIIGQTPAQVIAISPDGREGIQKLKSKSSATYSILSDEMQSIAQEYELNFTMSKAAQRRVNFFSCAGLKADDGEETVQIPVPAVYIIGQSGKIEWRYFNYDFRQRPNVAEIVEALKD